VLHEEIEAAETKQLCIEVSQQSLCSWLAKIGQGLWLILFRNFQLYQLHIFLCWFYQELKLQRIDAIEANLELSQD
jgi:hypothetical protein